MSSRILRIAACVALMSVPATASAQLAGPDTAGYRAVWTDHDFVPLSTGLGTLLTSSNDTVDIVLPWTFPWYGVDYPSVTVDVGAGLAFDPIVFNTADWTCTQPLTLQPDLGPYRNYLGDFGDPTSSVWAWIDFAGDRVVLSWEGVVAPLSLGSAGPYDFQVHLHSDGLVEFHYATIEAGQPEFDGGLGAGVSFQDASGGTDVAGNASTIACDEALLTNGSSIAITTCADADGDGSLDPACGFDDCDESDPTVYPGAPETCDATDSDCDPATDGDSDLDSDEQSACGGDCDDTDPLVFDGGVEVCNGVDDDCNGLVDDAPDVDGDGSFPCVDDCDDADPAVFPGADEVCNGIDDDCDGQLFDDELIGFEPTYYNANFVGVADHFAGALFAPSADLQIEGFELYLYTQWSDTATFRIYQGTEEAGPFTLLAEQEVYFANDLYQWVTADDLPVLLQEGNVYVLGLYYGPSSILMHSGDNGFPLSVPGGTFLSTWREAWATGELVSNYPPGSDLAIHILAAPDVDDDGDGQAVCSGDCDDADPALYWGAPEVCNAIDDDCDFVLPADEQDVDGDGFLQCDGDCDDTSADIYPGAPEGCDLIDTDCDGSVPSDETDDLDGDGAIACEDCDDGDMTVGPGFLELCDDLDNDCDGALGEPFFSRAFGANGGYDEIETFVGNVFQPSTDLTLRQIEVYGELDPGDAITWLVYEAPSLAGPWTQAASWQSQGLWALGSNRTWRASPPWSVPLQTGLYYAMGLWVEETANFGINDSATFPAGDDRLPSVAGASYQAAAPLSAPSFFVQLTNSMHIKAHIAGETDADADGVGGCLDCDDDLADTYPGAPELCDALDNDCDQVLPVGELDGDGDGLSGCAGDCDDAEPTTFPGAPELCDGVDSDCDGVGGADEQLDGDGDGAAQCEDCDDADPARYPTNVEVCSLIDEDCDGIGFEGDLLALGTEESGPWTPNGFAFLLEVDQDVVLHTIEMYGFVEEDVLGEWMLYEAPTTAGPYTLSLEVPGEILERSTPAWFGSQELSWTLTAGAAYAIGWNQSTNGIKLHEPDSIGGVSSSWGTLETQYANLGSSASAPSSLQAWWFNYGGGSLRLNASTDGDADGDAWLLCEECDDSNAAVNPGLTEVAYNGVDDDCDPTTLDDDLDGDGSTSDVDCDDADATTYPGAPELCDGLDNDCDGALWADESDGDGDGVALCSGDCDDADPTVSPLASEACNGEDDDCDGWPDLDEVDVDGDGSLACIDCDDGDPSQTPGAPELCDGLDNDCDGSAVGENDGDGDGFRACEECDDGDADVQPDAIEVCDGVDNDCDPSTDEDGDVDDDGWSPCDGDCDDTEDTVNPDQPEICDGLDNDCDPSTSENVDNDGDGTSACEEDCDDTNPNIGPDLKEECDGLDTNCDGTTPSNEDDDDGDGQAPCAGDCNDSDEDTYDGAPELCDGVDNDCDGTTSDEGEDADIDGFSPCNGDCDDTDAASNPDAEEVCDGADNDCDGDLPDDEADEDEDGSLACADDCDDEDGDVHPGAPEDTDALCEDGIDNDCDGYEDGEDTNCGGEGGGGRTDRGCACSEGGGSGTAWLLLLLIAVRRRRGDGSGRPFLPSAGAPRLRAVAEV